KADPAAGAWCNRGRTVPHPGGGDAMNGGFAPDDDLLRRLPLPLAPLVRHAHNAKTPLESCLAAFRVWEAAVKLLGAGAAAVGTDRPGRDPARADLFRPLIRPSLGHWWALARDLTPLLSPSDDGYRALQALLLDKQVRADLPRTAGLDAALRELLGGGGARATVRLTELFGRLIEFRNRYIGHGAPEQLPAATHGRLAGAFLSAAGELFGRLDVLAGRR